MVVTGTSRGIGRGIAEYFLGQGYLVSGCSRGPSSIEHDGYEHSTVDIGNDEQVRQWIISIGREHGRIDVVVNNAGISGMALALMTSTDLVENIFKTNFMGTFAVSREAAKVMLKRRYGRIINISSIATDLHMRGSAAYAASKSAMVEFTKILAKELGSSGITCNVITLPLVEEGMSAELSDEAIEQYEQNLVMKRWATLDDICHVVGFFASPGSGLVTGQVIKLGFVN